MTKLQLAATGLVLLIGVGLGTAILRGSLNQRGGADAHEEADHEHEGAGVEEAGEKGPHGGRMLRDGDFGVEVTIFERGVPPEFRVYSYKDGRPLPTRDIDLTIELRRLGGRVDAYRFRPQQDYLVGDHLVDEPHSFDVSIIARDGEATHQWQYPSHEGRVELSDEALRAARVEVEAAGPATIRTTLRLTGWIVPNEDRLAHVIPRFPGVVKEVRKRLGDRVEKGELIAVVQSNESLQAYEVRAPIAGTVISKHATPGEFIAQDEDIYIVADLSSVWVDLNVYRQDFERLRVGQRVVVDGGEGIPKTEGTISYISPFGASSTQTMLARVELPNPTGVWRPGLFVSGEVVVDEATVPVAVKVNGLQTLRDWDVVFVREGDVFEAQPLELGRRDPEWVEVVSGLRPGQRYAAANGFILKAELGKAGAQHEH